MPVKTKKAFSLDEVVVNGLKALAHSKRKSVSSVLEKIIKEKLEEEVKAGPFLKLEMADIAYAEPEEQEETEELLKSMSKEDLAPAGKVIINTESEEVVFKKL